MTDADTLRTLDERLRDASGPDRALFLWAWEVLIGAEPPSDTPSAVRRYRFQKLVGLEAWLDACAALQDERFPGCRLRYEHYSDGHYAVLKDPDGNPLGHRLEVGDWSVSQAPDECNARLRAIVAAAIAELEAKNGD